MTVTGVTYFEDGRRTVTVSCACGLAHEIEWTNGGSGSKRVELPCGVIETVRFPPWAKGSGYRTGYAKHRTSAGSEDLGRSRSIVVGD